MNTPRRWACLEQAMDHDPATRVAWWVGAPGQAPAWAGSIDRPHREAVCDLDPAGWLRADNGELHLTWPAEERDARFAALNHALRRAGLILGWRDETYPVWPLQAPAVACVHGGSARPLARIERAAARFWGSLTLGAHCNGWVADALGRPTHLWIGRRSPDKATDPGRLDNLVGGGVPDGQTPFETLQREGWEEAGLSPEQVAPARAGGVLALCHDLPEGLQREVLYAYDLQLPAAVVPINQDGEVAAFTCLDVHAALDAAAHGEMTVDAALVTLDFGLRHGLLGSEAAALEARRRALGVFAR